MPAKISDSRIEGGGDGEKGRANDVKPAVDDDDTKLHNNNTTAAQESNDEGYILESGFEDGKVNVNADKIVQIMEIINDLTEVTNECVPQQSLQGLTSNGPRLAGMVDDRAKQEDSNIEDKPEVRKLTECIEKEMKAGDARYCTKCNSEGRSKKNFINHMYNSQYLSHKYMQELSCHT